MKNTIRIGTRGSELALRQTEMVIEKLKQSYPEWDIEKIVIRTQGDKILDKPLIDFGGKGVFINEFEEALLDGTIDFAVHSSKDMPTELSEGLVIAGVLPRADARDVLVTKKGLLPKGFVSKDMTLEQLGLGQSEENALDFSNVTIGTGSPRRQFQLKKLYPNMKCIAIRGNVPTRLQKIKEGICDGVVLAAAGLSRLGLLEDEAFDYRYFTYDEMVPAGGQGIIAIEGRAGDELTGLVEQICDKNTYYELETERSILKQLEAGCHEAIGVISHIDAEVISIRIIHDKEGILLQEEGKAPISERLELATKLVEQLSCDGRKKL